MKQLKVSELIEQLQGVLEEHGDVPVRFISDGNEYDDKGDSTPVAGVAILMNDDDTPDYATICDQHALDAFM